MSLVELTFIYCMFQTAIRLNYSHHRWKGKPFTSEYIKNFCQRLREILHLRTLHRQLTRLLSVKEQDELNTADTFQPFSGLNPLQYNAYTEPVWRMAVTQFERCLVPTEDRVAGKLKSQLRNINRNTLQVRVSSLLKSGLMFHDF